MIQIGQPEQFALIRHFLRSRFSEEIVAAALGVASVRDFDKREPGRPIRDPLVRMFFAGAAVPLTELQAVLPHSLGKTMADLGLITGSDTHAWCTVVLYPMHGLHLISDRFTQPDGSPFSGDREFVYFALTANTQNYIEALPTERGASFLDIGAGCGAAALIQARYVDHAVSSDISPRSSLFAEFNRQLNDIQNVAVVEGSLYEPVADAYFDRIGCHPPYDVSGSAPWTFADGGDDGEFVIRGTIGGLAEHLAPGGEFTALFRAGDKKSQALEHRVREWLGPQHEEFDIALAERSIVSVEEYAVGAVLSTSGSIEQYREYLRKYEALDVERLVYCNLLIRRKRSASAPVTLRKEMGQRCAREEMAWLLNFHSAVHDIDFSHKVLMPSPAAEIVVRHKLTDGSIQPIEYTLHSTVPFSESMPCPQWVALLLSECTGGRTALDVYAAMKERGPIESSQFNAAVLKLLSAGMLQLSSGNSSTSST